MVTWNQILFTLLDPPNRPIRGTIVSRMPSFDPNCASSAGGTTISEVTADGPETIGEQRVSVWRDGARMRIESPDGEAQYLSDGVTSWSRAPRLMFISQAATPHDYRGTGSEILTVRSPMEWRRDDYTRPTDTPIAVGEYLGRESWNVELAPPPHKTGPMQLVVDAETGAILQCRNDDLGSSVSFVDFAIDEQRNDAYFQWNGPAQTREQHRDAIRREAQSRRQADIRWIHEHLVDRPLAVTFEATLSPCRLHRSEDDVEATFESDDRQSIITVARRTRSTLPWTNPAGMPNARFWSTDRWDWAVGSLSPVSTASIEAIRTALPHDGAIRQAEFPTSRR